MKKFYVSTPIFYPSGKPHLGHAFSTLYASVLKEYKQLLNYDCFFVTGTDEHGQKIEEAAAKEKLTPKEFVDNNSKVFKDLWTIMGIKYDFFIRTTDTFHKDIVKIVFDKLMLKNYIYLGKWRGLYCVSCEENYSKINVIDQNGKFTCLHGHELIEKNEDSYFLKISMFNDWIIDFLKNNKEFLFPENRTKELINNFLIDNKLEDLSITRTTFDWGIKINSDHKHVVYVWLDALINYISALGYKTSDPSNFEKYWCSNDCQKVHLIGKEITRFHCIYWPIILKMLDLPLPDKIISHGWIITETGKMSKSLGNVIDPIDVINKYGRDSFRYFLLKEISIKEDSIFSYKQFIATYNTDFANNYGNLISRTIGMLTKYNNKVIPSFNQPISELDKYIVNSQKELLKKIEENIENLNLSELIKNVCIFQNDLNLYIEKTKPWILKSENKQEELNAFLSILTNSVRTFIAIFKPILIDTTYEAIKQLNLDEKLLEWNSLTDFSLINNLVVNDSQPLFKRIEIDKIE